MAAVKIIGAGLAGCECAFGLARRGHAVTLHEMRPGKSIHLGPNGGVQMLEPLGAETKTRVGQVEIRPRETTHLQVGAPAAE